MNLTLYNTNYKITKIISYNIIIKYYNSRFLILKYYFLQIVKKYYQFNIHFMIRVGSEINVNGHNVSKQVFLCNKIFLSILESCGMDIV